MNLLPQIVISGLLIGILISAPMGPIGMLCIQRTLNKGRWPAFFTGVGAAFSDLIYCLLAGLGMSFITDFISANQALLQLLGSIVLAGFAFYLFRKNPTRSLQSQTMQRKRNLFTDFGTGFLITFSNPLILFFIIGLFARFNFLVPEYLYYHYVAGYAGIFGGALLWWYTITFFVNKVRAHFNVRSMWILNRVIAVILFIMAAFGCVMSIKSFIS
ncbi:MAG: LysE family translocator [Muribaculaceae bacterium]|nr:LysE family translocator [Muribaculaceae bacterium]